LDSSRLVGLGFADKGAVLHLAEVTNRLVGIFRQHATELVATHAFEGGHPDHDATAFAVHAAAEMLRRSHEPVPVLVEMPFYYWRNGTFVAQQFLQSANHPAEIEIQLDPESQSHKRRMLAAYKSQAQMLANFPLQCAERIRQAPAYDFTDFVGGDFGYERLTPGIDAARWRSLVQEARLQLGLE
jgi:LmbE family N-acetylglucosaminyl deacetylase